MTSEASIIPLNRRSNPKVSTITIGIHKTAWSQKGGDQTISTHAAKAVTMDPTMTITKKIGPSPLSWLEISKPQEGQVFLYASRLSNMED